MSTATQPSVQKRTYNKESLVAALERGELVRLLAEIEAGNLTSDQLEEAMQARARKHWFRTFLMDLFGK